MTRVAITIGTYPYGDSAFEALAHAVRRVKEVDPLSPCTIVVEGGRLGLSVRRRLAAVPPGVVQVRCSTWTQLAAELAQPWLSAGAKTVPSAAVELEAVRTALLAETPPRLAGALDQPATLRALARTIRELAPVPDAVLHALAAQSPRAADVVGVARRARAALSGCITVAELFGAAAAEVRRAPGQVAEACGAVTVYLPRRSGEIELGLMGALGACTDVEVIAGTTGDAVADAGVRQLVARLSKPSGRGTARADRPAETAQVHVTAPTCVRSAPSADAEVLIALRHLMGRNAEGVPLERMALLHSGASPYRQLVHDAVVDAGIPAYGGSARPLSSTVAGRALVGALALADHDWRRDDVVAWLASAPLLHDGRPVPAAEWDALSVEAGVVGGLRQWRERLVACAATSRDAAGARGRGGDGDAGNGEGDEDSRSSRRARRLELDARRCDELRMFLDSMAERLGHVPTSWEGWSDWAGRLLADLLGTPARRAGWPTDEIVALDAVTAALGRIGALDRLGGRPPNVMDFRTALAAELDAPAPETARVGHGLLIGQLEEAIGLDLDVVCVVGMVDGAFSGHLGDDVLLPDRERERAGEEVPLRGADAVASRRDFLAALASADERVLSYPRYDQRRGSELRPARALLESVDALAADGRRRSVRELRDGPPPGLGGRFQFVASFADAVRDGGPGPEPVSDADWRLRSLTRWVCASGWASDHFLARDDRVLADALAVRRARRSGRFTRFDGLVERLEIPSPKTGAVQSATGLEGLARCPRRYFFSHLLHVTAHEPPETILQLTPADRGVIVHRVLERLVAEEIARDVPDGEDVGAREARMLTFAEEEFADAERRGVTGHPALWALERSRMASDLREHLRVEAEYRAATGARPLAVELDFGPASGTDVSVDTSRGAVRFRGRIDRIDELADGGIAVVDYKSGKRYGPPENGDPLSRGERLQLPIYTLAAKAAYGEGRKVRAGYWYVGSPTAPDWMALDDVVQSRLADVLAILAQGIETGRFPARPGPTDARNPRGSNCTYCAYDGMCPPDRGASWRRKRSDPALSAYVSLVGET